jgi:hypothetical protein
MNRLKVSALAAAITVLAPLAALAQTTNVAGAWDLTLSTPQGENTVNVTFKQDGDKLTGTLSSPMGEVPLTGTATAGSLKATANLDVQGMALEMAFTGKVAGDTLDGMVKVGDFGEFPFTGKRAASKTPGAPAATAAAPAAAPARPAAGGASAGNAGGKWDVTLSIAGAGDFPMTATLTQMTDKVAGTISSQAGDVPVSGTMTGNALKLEFVAQTPQGDIAVTMTGTLGAAGFTGKASIAGMGEADWTAKRAQ